MGLVETIRKKPAVGATIGSVCLLTALIVLYSTQVGPSRFSPPKLFYFSDDDGKTFFADDANKVPPFDKDGKQAVLAHVYKNSAGTMFVGYLERAPNDQAKQLIEQTRAEMADNAKAGNPAPDPEKLRALSQSVEVKKPGGSKWVSATSAEAASIYALKDTDGSEPTPVMP